MTISEYSELTLRIQAAEKALMECQKTLQEIKEQMKQIGGELKPQSVQQKDFQNPFSGHTPYFDMLGINPQKTDE